nr:sulfite exporter TauE/SafE family protein [Photobacterium halotolerans]
MITLFFGAIAVGLSLGMLGSGGAILTLPILAYGLGQTEKQAIASALIIVGIISSITSFNGIRQRLVNWSLVMLFGFPGMAGTYLGAWFASYLDGAIQMTVFAVVMLAAAWRMFQPVGLTSSHAQTQSYWLTGLQGLLVGVLTGFVGVGGGFLIVPALVLLSGLTMQTAVATSLVIIVMNSLIGFLTYQDVLALTHPAGLACDCDHGCHWCGGQFSRATTVRAVTPTSLTTYFFCVFDSDGRIHSLPVTAFTAPFDDSLKLRGI